MSNFILLNMFTIAKVDEFTRLVMLGDTYCSFNIYISINFMFSCFVQLFSLVLYNKFS